MLEIKLFLRSVASWWQPPHFDQSGESHLAPLTGLSRWSIRFALHLIPGTRIQAHNFQDNCLSPPCSHICFLNILASIAVTGLLLVHGIDGVYGREWRAQPQLGASRTNHTSAPEHSYAQYSNNTRHPSDKHNQRKELLAVRPEKRHPFRQRSAKHNSGYVACALSARN